VTGWGGEGANWEVKKETHPSSRRAECGETGENEGKGGLVKTPDVVP